MLVLLGAGRASADTIVVHAGESIQAAIDSAPAGSSILVQPGVYHETGDTHGLTITQDAIELIGASEPDAPVVLEQAGDQRDGIWVSPTDTVDLVPPADEEHPPCGVSGARVKQFLLRGFTVQGFPGFGIYLACVDGFTIANNVARQNDVYAMFPVRSRSGRILRNVTSGTTADACIYVGQDEDIYVNQNQASECLIGFQIENSRNVRMDGNESFGNTAGFVIDVINDRLVTIESDNQVTNNVVRDNNLTNMAPSDSDNAGLPAGLGIVINGADRTLVSSNTITGNGFAGIAISNACQGIDCSKPLDIDPAPDFNRIVGNTIENNGTDSSGPFAALAADIIYLPDSGSSKARGNCFSDNSPDLTVMPPVALPACARPAPPLHKIVR